MGMRRSDVGALLESGRLTIETLRDLRDWMRDYPDEVDVMLGSGSTDRADGVGVVHLGSVELYADGACQGNPGPGGLGVFIRYGDGSKREISRGFRKTTNNRMELCAVIVGIEAIDASCEIKVFSDSQYVVNAVNKGWACKWRSNGWRKSGRGYALNPDLWERLLTLVDVRRVSFYWVKGHSGVLGNERADALAVRASQGDDLLIDKPYEAQNP